MKQLEKIIEEISNLNKENIIEEIKSALQEKDPDTYNKWKEDEFNVNHLFYGQDTLLHLVAEDDTIEIVEALIKNGANVNAVGHFEETPLHHAARFGQAEIMKVLIKNGANVNAVDELENTPLHTAILEAPGCLKTAIVKILIENGADVNAVNGYNEQTPLHSIATLSDSVDTVRVLIKNGASVNALDFDTNTPLHLAAKYGCLEIVQALIENGADPNVIKYGRETPLHLAAQNNHLEVVKYLVDNRADIYAQNIDRKMPIECAKEKGYKEIVEYLIGRIAKIPHDKDRVLQAYQDDSLDNDISLTDYHALRGKKIDERKEEKLIKKKSGCLIQSHQRQQKKFISHYLPNIEIKPVRQGLYLPSFETRGVKINGKCTAITRGFSQALLLHGKKAFLSNLEASAKIYERIVQGRQISKREEGDVFAFSKLLDGFEQELDSSTNSLPSSLVHTQGYKTFSDLSNYIAGVKGDFAIHLVTNNHVVAIYRTDDNYTYFDSNVAFVSGLESADQLIEVVEKAVEFAGYKVEGKGFLLEHFNVARANNQLPDEDKQVLTKEIKTERQLLAEQDKEFGLIKINGRELSRVQLYDFGTKINVEGGVPLFISADMNLDSKSFSDYLSAGKISMTAREYLDNLKNSKNVEEVVRATKVIPFIGSKREIEEAEQKRRPLLELVKGTINCILAAVSLSWSKNQLPGKIGDKPKTCLNNPTMDNQLQKSL